MYWVRRVSWIVGWAWLLATAIVLIALVGLRLAGGQVDLIESNSMAPSVPIDSVAITLPADPVELVVGDVITFRNGEDRLVMHRVTEVLEAGDVRRFRTKGDANRTTDPLLVHENGVQRQLWFSVGGAGPVARAAQFPMGIFWFAVLPALLLVCGIRRSTERGVLADLTGDMFEAKPNADASGSASEGGAQREPVRA